MPEKRRNHCGYFLEGGAGVTNSCHMQENRVGCLIRLPIQRSLAIFNCVLKYQAQGNLSEEQFENVY